MKFSSHIARYIFPFCLLGLPILAIPVYADDITHIYVVSAQWQGYTNKDGSGAYWEIVKAVFEAENITVKTRTMPWARAKLFVENNQADALVGSYYQQEKHNKGLIFPKWHISIEDPIIALFKKGTISNWHTEGLKALQNKRLVWIRGYSFEESLLQGIPFNKRVITKPRQALVMLKLNRADVFLDYETTIRQAATEAQIELDGEFQMEIAKAGNKLFVAFANTARSRALIKIFDERMDTLIKTGKIKAIYEKWGLGNYKFQP